MTNVQVYGGAQQHSDADEKQRRASTHGNSGQNHLNVHANSNTVAASHEVVHELEQQQFMAHHASSGDGDIRDETTTSTPAKVIAGWIRVVHPPPNGDDFIHRQEEQQVNGHAERECDALGALDDALNDNDERDQHFNEPTADLHVHEGETVQHIVVPEEAVVPEKPKPVLVIPPPPPVTMTTDDVHPGHQVVTTLDGERLNVAGFTAVVHAPQPMHSPAVDEITTAPVIHATFNNIGECKYNAAAAVYKRSYFA